MDRNLTKQWFKELENVGTVRTLKSQQILIDVGELVNTLFLIKQGGLVLLHIHPKTGEQRAINFFIPNFHPIASIAEPYYLKTSSDYQLKTFTTTTLIEIDRKHFDHLFNKSDFASSILDFGIKSLLEKNEMRAKLISYSSEEMLQYLHLNYPQILQNVPSKYVANFLGITAQWLSKLKHKL